MLMVVFANKFVPLCALSNIKLRHIIDDKTSQMRNEFLCICVFSQEFIGTIIRFSFKSYKFSRFFFRSFFLTVENLNTLWSLCLHRKTLFGGCDMRVRFIFVHILFFLFVFGSAAAATATVNMNKYLCVYSSDKL